MGSINRRPNAPSSVPCLMRAIQRSLARRSPPPQLPSECPSCPPGPGTWDLVAASLSPSPPFPCPPPLPCALVEHHRTQPTAPSMEDLSQPTACRHLPRLRLRARVCEPRPWSPPLLFLYRPAGQPSEILRPTLLWLPRSATFGLLRSGQYRPRWPGPPCLHFRPYHRPRPRETVTPRRVTNRGLSTRTWRSNSTRPLHPSTTRPSFQSAAYVPDLQPSRQSPPDSDSPSDDRSPRGPARSRRAPLPPTEILRLALPKRACSGCPARLPSAYSVPGNTALDGPGPHACTSAPTTGPALGRR